jgi:hypothetical protein
MPGVTILPSGLFDTQQTWKANYEQWRNSRVCFVDDIRGVKDESKYDRFPSAKEFERILASIQIGRYRPRGLQGQQNLLAQ